MSLRPLRDCFTTDNALVGLSSFFPGTFFKNGSHDTLQLFQVEGVPRTALCPSHKIIGGVHIVSPFMIVGF